MIEETGTPASTEETTEEETQVETSEETTETPEQESGESVEEYKARLQKAEELAENYKKRAEKAEKKAKETPQASDLSQQDIIFLAKTDIHEDDIPEVTEWARFKKISVKEAYEQLKPKLAVEAEHRKTEAATQTSSPRGVKPVSGEDILAKAEKTGEIPETEEGMRKLQEARLARFKKKE